MTRSIALLVIAVIATGCVSARDKFVIFPMHAQAPEQIDFDRMACEQFAKDNRNNNEALQGASVGAAMGAGAGALNGAISGAYVGRAGQYAGVGAGVGAGIGLAAGAIGGAIADHQRYLRIYAMCMQLRGYSLTGSLRDFGIEVPS